MTAVSDRDRNQHLATYKNIGFDKPVIPISTTKSGLEEPFKQKQFHEPVSKPNRTVSWECRRNMMNFLSGNGWLRRFPTFDKELPTKWKRLWNVSGPQWRALARSAGASQQAQDSTLRNDEQGGLHRPPSREDGGRPNHSRTSDALDRHFRQKADWPRRLRCTPTKGLIQMAWYLWTEIIIIHFCK